MTSDLQRAIQLHKSGQYKDAEALYRTIIAAHPQHAPTLHLLGVLCAQTNRLGEAKGLIAAAVKLQPRNMDFLFDLAKVISVSDREEAASVLRTILRVAPTHVDARITLANFLIQRGNFREAERVCRDSPPLKSSELSKALGLALQRQGQKAKALAQFEEAVAENPRDADAAYYLGMCHHDRHDDETAAHYFKAALAENPSHPGARFCLGESLIAQGLTSDGRKILDELIAAQPKNWRARWARLLAFPIVCRSQGEHEDTLRDFENNLTLWEKIIASASQKELIEISHAVQYKTSFMLHYHGEVDRSLQTRYGSLITQVACAAIDLPPPSANPPPSKGDRIRIGFASSHLHNHSVAKTHGAWITSLSAERFEKHIFHLHTYSDDTTERLKQHATYHNCGALSASGIVSLIAAQHLDVLIWLDIGMDAKTQVPAALRLAPIQATTWGHPVTSGLRSIDYYLSSDLMEPIHGDDHYSEQLVRLPNLSIAYPVPPNKARTAPELISRLKGTGRVVYLCAQNLIKLQPENDHVFADIAVAVPESVFVFIEHRKKIPTEIFLSRLTSQFRARGVDPTDRLHVVPRLDQNDFLALNREVDIVLDSIGWAGCNSTLEALANNRPVVTISGNTMRAGHGSGILEMAGLDELIAADKDGYVRIASQLGNNADWRSTISNKIADCKKTLFEDAKPIEALTDWLESVTRTDRSIAG